MSFLHPAFLWALTLLAIPVLIHLFQLRRFKRIDFSDVRLLAEVSRQTRARKKVQHWLVLLARCLALIALVFAFAQPYLPTKDQQVTAGTRAVSVYIDDSYSMDAQNPNGRLLDQARKGAQDAVMAYGAADRFQVLTGSFEGRQRSLIGRDEAVLACAQADAAPYTRALSKVLARQREALSTADATARRAFLFTDLQRGITDVEEWTNDSTIPTVIVPLVPGSVTNLSLDSVWFGSPVRRIGQDEELHVRIANHGPQELVNVPVRLAVDGAPRALATFTVQGNAVVDTVMHFRNDVRGLHWGEVSIQDQPVTFDDKLWIAYRTVDHLRVLLISGDAEGDRAVEAVFSGDSTHRFALRNYRELDLALLEEQDLVVLNGLPEIPSGTTQAIDAFLHDGGAVAFFPPTNGDPSRSSSFFPLLSASLPTLGDTARVQVERIDLEAPFFRDVFQTMPRNVDLPVVRERWNLRPAPGSDVLLRLQDGSAYLSRTNVGRGSAYLCASPLAESAGNLTRHALFATTLLRMTELARPMGRPYGTIGGEAVLTLDGIEIPGERPPHLRGPNGIDLLPEVRRTQAGTGLVLHDEELIPGPYALVVENDTLAALALNRSRLESDPTTITVEDLQARMAARGLTSFSVLDGDAGDLSLRLAELDQGRKLWKWFIVLALLALTAETLLIRLKR